MEQSRTDGNKPPKERVKNSTHYAVADCPGCVGGLSAASLLDCPRQGVGLSAGHLPENTVTENSSGLDCVLSSGLSIVWARTIRGSKDRKQKQQNRFWTRLHSELRTVRRLAADCPRPELRAQQSLPCARPRLADCPRFTGGLSVGRVPATRKSPQTQDRPICGRFKTNCHQIWTKRTRRTPNTIFTN